MPDDMTGEVGRRFDQIDAALVKLTTSIESMTEKLTADFYHIRDVERRVIRLEKLLMAMSSATIGLAVELLLRYLS